MRVSRPALWFLEAAKESSPQSTAVSRRFLHATCRCQQDENRKDINGARPAQEEHNAQLTPIEPNIDRDDTSLPYDPKLKSSWWGPKHAKRALAERRQRANDVRKQLKEGVKHLRRYTPKEIEELRNLYTPQQIEALLAAEEVINPEDVVTQGEVRTDPAGLAYLDDLASVDPVLDKLAQSPEIQYGTDLDGRPSKAFDDEGPEAAGPGKERKQLTAAQKRLQDADEDPHLLRLCQQTGFTKEQIKSFYVKRLVQRRVTNQTRMGKIMSQYELTVAGNGNGLLGVGEGKSAEGDDAHRQAVMNAIRNMRPVHRYENRTIYGEVEGKIGAVNVKLMPRAPGKTTCPTILSSVLC